MNKSFISLPLLLIASGHLAVDLGQGALPVLLPFMQELFGLTYTQVGIIVMVQNFTASVMQPLFGYIVDKIYWAPFLPISIIIAASGMAVSGYAPSYYWLLVIVSVAGLGSAVFHPQGAVVANSLSEQKSRGKSMGLFSVGGNLGFALGSLFMAFLLNRMSGLSSTIYFAIPGVLAACIIWLTLDKISANIPQFREKKQSGEQKNPVPLFTLFILLTVIFIRSTIHASLQTYVPLYYIKYLHQEPAYASYLVALFLTGGALGTFIGASLSDYFGRKTIITLSLVVSSPLIALFPRMDGLLAPVLIFLSGLTLVAPFATTLVLAQEMMPGRVGVASGLTIGFSIGLGGIGTTLLGMAADRLDLPSVMTILAILPIFGILFALRLPGRLFVK